VKGSRIETELSRILSPYIGSEYDVLVLGCTHYPFLKPVLHAMMGTGVQILDSGGAVARQVEHILLERGEISKEKSPTSIYVTTGDEKVVSEIFSNLLQHEVSVRHIMV
jgi:glutamate racemase